MSNLIRELTEKVSSASLEEVRINYVAYQKLVGACQAQLLKVSELINQEQRQLAKQKLNQLLVETQYEEPTYASINYEDGDAEETEAGSNGFCHFTNSDQANELIKSLVNQSYYYGHDLKWNGPGIYTIIPPWKYDHDGEVIYTATYKKEAV